MNNIYKTVIKYREDKGSRKNSVTRTVSNRARSPFLRLSYTVSDFFAQIFMQLSSIPKTQLHMQTINPNTQQVRCQQAGAANRLNATWRFFSVMFMAFLFLVAGAGQVQAQTTLISPTGEGGFENGPTLAANNWLDNSGAQTNKWFAGSVAVSSAGSNSAYISSSPTGATYDYNINAASVVAIYRDFTVPAGETKVTISFKWKSAGESCCDYLRVWLTPTTFTPTAGTQTASGSGNVQLGGNLNNNTTYQTFTNVQSLVPGQSYRLIFEWRNDGSLGPSPAASVDEVSVVSAVPQPANAAPINFSATAVTQTGFTINWEDNSTNETAFRVYRSTDNITFTQQGSDIASTSTATTGTAYNLAQTGLVPGVTYFYRIAAVFDLESAFLTGSQATNAPGNIVSTGVGGNWSVGATWVGGVAPTATDNVTIADGATVTIDNTTPVCLNLTVGQGTSGILQYIGGATAGTLIVYGDVTVSTGATFTSNTGTGTKALRLGGPLNTSPYTSNLTVNGTFQMNATATAFVSTSFFGNQNGTVSGTGSINFGPITVSKGTTATGAIQDVTAVITQTAPTASGNRLTITNGTFRLSSASTLTPYFAGQTICASTGRLWLNNSGASIQCVGTGTTTGAGAPTVTGILKIDAGTFGYGSGNNTLTFSSGSGILDMTGGTLNHFGGVNFPSSAGTQFNMSGGNINVDVQAGNSTTTTAFSIGASTTVNWSGGNITIIDPAASSGNTAWSATSGGTKSITGGTLRIGDGTSTTSGGTLSNTSGFGITSGMPIWDLVIDNRTDANTSRMARITGQTNVLNSITINPNAYLFTGTGTASNTIIFTGATLTNNGTLAGTEPGGTQSIGTIQYGNGATGAQSIAGSGSFVNLGSVSVNNNGGLTLNQVNQLNAVRVNVFDTGNVVNSAKLTLGLGGTSSSFVQFGQASGTAAVGTFDVAPTFNLGSGGLSIIYSQEGAARTSGVEIPVSRTLQGVTINNTNGVTLSGGAASTAALTLTAGNLNTSSANLLTVTGTTTGAITGGSATSFVNGPIARALPASLIIGSTYNFPTGKSGYNNFQLVNPTTNAGGTVTVQAEVFDGNSGGTPGNLMGSINTSRYWAASITDGGANFTNTLVRLNDTRGTQDAIAASATQNGAYDQQGGVVATLATNFITTTAPELTNLPGFFLMGNLAAASLSNLAITPSGNQCTNVARTVTVTATPGGAPVATVVINYQVDGGANQQVSMTNIGGNDWQGTIPTVTPANGTVTWSVQATDNNSLQSNISGTSYQDEPLFSVSVSAAASPSTVCSGSPSELTATVTQPSVNVTLGAGATTATSYDGIFYHLFGGNKSQFLVRASELTALGLTAGNITSLGINIASGTGTYNGFSVQIGHTTQTVMNSTLISSGLSEVFSSPSYSPSTGVNTFNFTSPFNWNGTDNVVIQFCWSNNNGGGTSNYARIDATPFVSCSYYRADNQAPAVLCANNTATSTTSNRPQFIFGKPGMQFSYAWSDGTNNVGSTNPVTVNPTSNTNYTVTITESVTGCTKTSDPITVTTLPLPTAPITAPSSQCGVGVPTCFAVGAANGNYRWYLTPTGGTAIPGEVNGTLSSYSISSTTTFYVAITDGTCESQRTAVVASVSEPDAVQALVDDNTPCLNTAISLSAQQTGSNQSYTYTWTASPEAGSGILNSSAPVGNPVSVTPTAVGTYIYTVTAVDGACTASSTVSVTVQALPAIAQVTATPGTVCAGAPVTLAGTNPVSSATALSQPFESFPVANFTTTGSGVTWTGSTTYYNQGSAAAFATYAADANGALAMNSGINLVGLLNPKLKFAQIVATENDYDVARIEYSTNGGTTWQGIPATAYQGSGVIPGFVSPNIAFQTNSYPEWSAQFTSSSSTYPAGPATALWKQETIDLSAFSSASDFRIRFAMTSDGSVQYAGWALDDVRIEYDSPISLNWSWDNGAGSGISVTVNPLTTTTYTATATDPATGCSATSSVTVTVNPIPADPTTTSSEQCGAVIPTASVSSNSGEPTPIFNWYDAPTAGNLLQSDVSATYLQVVSTTTTFYVSEITGAGCESGRVAVTVTVQDPDVLTVTSSSTNNVCLGASFDLSSSYTPDFNTFATFDLTATGGANSGVTGTVSLVPNATGSDPYTVTPSAPGSYTYTITAFDPDKGCTSIGTFTVTVNALPVITSVSGTPTTVCAGEPVNLSAVINGEVTGTAALGAGAISSSSVNSSFFPGFWGGAKTQYIIRASELTAAGVLPGAITSLAYEVVTVGQTYQGFAVSIGHTTQTTAPNPFISTGLTQVYRGTLADDGYLPVVGVNTLAFGTGAGSASSFVWDGTSNIVINICWSRVPSASTASATTMKVDNTGFTSSCYRQRDNLTPAAMCAETTPSTTTSAERPRFIIGGQVIGNIASNYTWEWNPGAVSGFNVTVNPTTTTAYTATVTDGNGCSATSAPVNITVNPLPAAPVTNDPVVRCGPGVVNLTATGGAGTLNWYNVPTGGTSLQTGGAYSPTVTSSTVFYVSETSAEGCEGPRSAVNVTVNAAPNLAINAIGSTTFCEGGSVVLDASSTSDPSYINFSWSPATGLSSTNTAVVNANPPAGTYIYTVTADDGISGPAGCSNTAIVTVTVNPNPVITSATANPANICIGGSSALVATSIPSAPGTAALGAGGTNSSSTNASFFPGGWGGAKTQYIIRASELSALGFVAGPITSLGYEVTVVGQTYQGFAVSLGHTTQTTATTTFISSGLTQVYRGTLTDDGYLPVVGVNTLAFGTGAGSSSSFVWDGTSNIVVNICWSRVPAASTSTSTTMKVDNPGFTSTCYRQRDNLTPAAMCAETSALSTGSLRPRFIIGGILGTDITNTLNWIWNPGGLIGANQSVAPTSTTSYTVTATNGFGCSTTSAPVTVNVVPVAANATATPSTPVCAGSSVALAANGTGGEPLSYSWSDGTTVVGATATLNVNPTVTTTYTVTVTDVCGNPTTSSVTVTVNPLPTVTVTPTSANFCHPGGTAVTLTASGADTYTWAPATGLSATTGASVDATPAVGTTYTVTGTDANGCTNTATAVISVSQNLTNVAATATANPICEGSTLNLAANHDPLIGYSMNANSGVAFIDISTTGTAVTGTLGDDSEHNITFPSFTFNNVAYTTARVGNNGAMVFGATTGDVNFSNAAFPNSQHTAGNVFLAPFWDDLDINISGNSIRTQTVGNKFIIQWTNKDHNSFTTGAVTFQVQLDLTTSEVHFVYQDVIFGSATYDAGASATVGIQWANAAGSFVQYSHNTASLSNGQSITFTPSTATYSWSGPNGFISTDRNPVINNVTAANAGVYTVNILTAAGCPATASTAAVVVNERPTGVLSGTDVAYCEGSVLPTTLSIAVTGTGPWSGTLSDGSTFSGSVSPITVNVTPSVTTTYTIATLTDANCASVAGDLSGSVTVTVNPLATTPVVNVTQPTCAVATGTLTITSPVGSGILYSLDGGPFQPTPVYSGVAPGPHTVDVQSAAGCGSTGAASVTVNPQPFIPAPPTVTGIVNVCPYIGTGTPITYTASAAGATSYTWTVPSTNVTIVSGQGTNTLTVTFANGFAAQASKQIRVRANSICGSSAQTIYYLAAQSPVTPGTITGPTNVCSFLGGPATATYTINKAQGAASYIWTAQSGTTTITSVNGPGENDTTITVLFAPGFTTSAITVQAVNDCGVSGVRSITVTRANPSTPSLIAGPTNVCEHIAPNGTAATYTVPLQPGVTTYTWTLPAGALNVTGQGTNTISFIYPAGYTGGNISVEASNGCGTSPVARTLTVSTLSPATPSVIDVINTQICPNREYTYSIASLPANATSVQWTVPAGATLVSGQGTTSITVTYPSTAIAGTVSAVAVNNCGTSVARNVEVKLPACPDPEFAKGVQVTPAPKQVDQMEVSVFPNPSVSDFKLQVRSKSNEIIHVRVLDMTGREYKVHQMMSNETLSLGSTLKAGAYILEIRQGKELKTTKVLKF